MKQLEIIHKDLSMNTMEINVGLSQLVAAKEGGMNPLMGIKIPYQWYKEIEEICRPLHSCSFISLSIG